MVTRITDVIELLNWVWIFARLENQQIDDLNARLEHCREASEEITIEQLRENFADYSWISGLVSSAVQCNALGNTPEEQSGWVKLWFRSRN